MHKFKLYIKYINGTEAYCELTYGVAKYDDGFGTGIVPIGYSNIEDFVMQTLDCDELKERAMEGDINLILGEDKAYITSIIGETETVLGVADVEVVITDEVGFII